MGKDTVVKMKMDQKGSFAKAIRAKCLDCSGGMFTEVRDCWAVNCPLFPWRMGCSPASAVKRLKKYYTVEVVK